MDNNTIDYKTNNNIFINNGKEIVILTDEDNREILLEDIYKNLKTNSLALFIFFNRWG